MRKLRETREEFKMKTNLRPKKRVENLRRGRARVTESYAIEGFRCQIREHAYGEFYTVKLTRYSEPHIGSSIILPTHYETEGGARGGLLGYLDRGNGLYYGLKEKKD